MSETDYIILKKIPFRESSLIVSGISPRYGKMDFIMRSHTSGKSGKFAVAGLFRELHVEFKEHSFDHRGLVSARRVELIESYDAIAENTKGYLAACNLSNMLLANTKPMLEIPGTYQILQTFLRAAAGGSEPEPFESLVYLVLLEESGELPPQDGRAGEFLTMLLDRARNGEALPSGIPEHYWKQLSEWRKIICRKMIP